jgi:hypothetical protein
MSRPNHSFWLALAALGILAGTAPAVLASEAGSITRMEGDVRIIRNKQTIQAKPGSEVQPKDRVVTGANGSAGITTVDKALLTLGPNSHLVIDEFAFNKQTQEGNMAVRFLKGTFAMVTGAIGKLSPERTKISTPTATIGIRGTEFVVQVDLPPELEKQVLALDK